MRRARASVIALSVDGKTVSQRTSSGSFRLRAPAATITLQLRDPRGRYAGPVVVRRGRGSVVLGIRAGARLGKIRVRSGYAAPVRRLPARSVATRVRARANHGVPLGAGNFGYVASPGAARSAATADAAPGADMDADGVPNAIDVDDDGDLALDNVDASQAQTGGFRSFSQMFLTVDQTVNANAAAVGDAEIDAAMKASGSLVLLDVPAETELDCGGLSYCSAGGSGQLEAAQPSEPTVGGDRFPLCCDGDGNGMGTMPLNDRREFRLLPRAGHTAIGSGDTLIQRRADGSEMAGTIGFVFNTVPAVTAWTDGSGASGTISYPAAADSPGSARNPLPITKNATGEYVLTLTLWRPQREAIPGAGEGDGFVDLGGLAYEANLPQGTSPPPQPPAQGGPAPATAAQAQPPTGTGPQCPPESLSTSDPNLTIAGNGSGLGQLKDAAPDRPANRANTLTFTVNLSACAAARGYRLDPGGVLNFDIAAVSVSGDHANQKLFLTPR